MGPEKANNPKMSLEMGNIWLYLVIRGVPLLIVIRIDQDL